ncbi:family 78 glycoside hydrolase catalytic domain, partial [candidate division KSB1 bacterium]|nr:family 78 glycoside hydrolase catalytic domain [candidate division KSB1 bacterium]
MLKIIEFSLADLHLAMKYFCLILMLPVLLWAQSSSKPTVTNLRTEYKTNPVGIDVLQPRFSWLILTTERGFMQDAYQIQAAESKENLQKGKNLLWDSGKVPSDQSNQVGYAGPALKTGQRVYWRVRIWDAKDKTTAWSEIAFWEMGLLNRADWQAKWIESEMVEGTDKSRPSPMFRKEFTLKGKVKTARAYVTAHGLYEMELNGQKVGDEVLTPGWTSYNKRLQYQTYDVTAQLKPGQNAVGATLGNGWYRGFLGWQDKRDNYGSNVGLLLQINIVYENGQTEIIGSDETWKVSTGPILMSEIYHGEIYDARLELDGWSRAGYADQTWKSVKVASHPKDILVAPPGLPVRKIQEIKPIGIIKTPKGETVVDMGQNMVGWLRLKVQGQVGHTVKLVHFEVLDKAGNVYLENLRVAKQTITYILKGAPQEIFEPHFTFQGFRYVMVENFPGTLALDNLTGVVVHSDMKLAGTFECSNPMLNQLQHNIQWGQKGNFVDVPTDCPQRDERMGWTGDAQVFAPTACFNHDVAAFYTKWLRDVAADQFENGAVPHVVPDVLQGGGSAAWADASVVVPWTVYLYYGDKRVLENQYESMKRWVGYMQSQAGESYLWNTGSHFGDWLAFATNRSDYPGATTDKDLIATAYFAYST